MSDTQTSFQDIKHLTRKFMEDRNWQKHHSPKNLSMALSVEVAELMEIMQWLTDQESRELSSQKMQVQEEIADIAIYLFHLCNALDVDLSEAIYQKMEKNAQKYPSKR